ncbi:3-isopropylmalate dehydratase small subunit [Sporolituus thermophilus]|uniref:3-isopropylmalate dehydratase small subunit n=1 Tax=Sporolituus thermophilus DSM 23256 TaxID=1123285 RepID=A0A1G7HHA7_9FIRM|nr:3-isopropylmalate dehydratase small subunit [Sporolituus thermophilus]SDE99887.1 3-isopropylmalate/(R)-2-methylmalate dehydratase small subunit [Sporolituus thermophilus DSM 23256]
MSAIVRGKVHKYGDNINTDIISPPQYMELSIAEAAKYAMSAIDPDFAAKVQKGDILVAGANFGSGSSRETSPLTLKYLGVGAIVAKFFARIFYRNAINLGIPVIECSDADKIQNGDTIEIDLETGIIRNITRQETYQGTRIPAHILELINEGGLVPYLKKTI